jgi:hypothetical protein
MTIGQKSIDVPPGATVKCHFEESTDGPIPLYRLRIEVNNDTYITDPTPDKEGTLQQGDDLLRQLQENGNGHLVEYDGVIVGNA